LLLLLLLLLLLNRFPFFFLIPAPQPVLQPFLHPWSCLIRLPTATCAGHGLALLFTEASTDHNHVVSHSILQGAYIPGDRHFNGCKHDAGAVDHLTLFH